MAGLVGAPFYSLRMLRGIALQYTSAQHECRGDYGAFALDKAGSLPLVGRVRVGVALNFQK